MDRLEIVAFPATKSKQRVDKVFSEEIFTSIVKKLSSSANADSYWFGGGNEMIIEGYYFQLKNAVVKDTTYYIYTENAIEKTGGTELLCDGDGNFLFTEPQTSLGGTEKTFTPTDENTYDALLSAKINKVMGDSYTPYFTAKATGTDPGNVSPESESGENKKKIWIRLDTSSGEPICQYVYYDGSWQPLGAVYKNVAESTS